MASARTPSRAEPLPPRRTGGLTLALGAALAALSVVAYLPAAWQGFVLGDDHNNFVFNPAWRGLGAEQLHWMWTTFHLGHWQPLTWMTFGAEYPLWGLTPGTQYPPEGARYHLLNLALHAAAAVLVFVLARRLLERALGERAAGAPRLVAWSAAAGAALWAVHPLRVENVAWATERRDLLATLLLLATTLSWIRWTEIGGRARLAGVLVLYALSLASKAWGMTLPVVLLVLDVYPLGRLGARGGGLRGLARLVGEKAVFAPLAIAGAVLAGQAQATTHATLALSDHGVAQRLAQAAYGLVFYVWKSLAPTGLSTHYLLERDLDVARWPYWGSAALVVAISAAAWLARRRWPGGLAAWLAYGVLVSPVLGLLQSGQQKVADRYAYLAAIPLCALAAGGIFLLLEKGRHRKLLAGVGGALLAVLLALSWRQTTLWKDSVTLYEQAIAVEPDNYIAQMNLATALREVGRLEEARAHTELSIRAEPGPANAYARFHLGLLRLMGGDFEWALATWREALEVDPAHQVTLEVASRELDQRGRGAEARALVEAALRARPDDTWVRGQLASRLWRAKEHERAEALWREGVARDERWAEGHEGLGLALVRRNALADAEVQLRRALELQPGRRDALLLLGRALRATGRTAEAEACWLEVLERFPGDEQAQQLIQQSRAASAAGR